MARPKKNKIDYFPHLVASGKTMFILEQKYGNDGYAFWFKLLELLGDTVGHSFCLRNDSNWEFLLAKTRVSDITATEILDTLAKLGAIDAELWEEKVIWCQNFIDNISDVYLKRKQKVPVKPHKMSFCDRNPRTTDVSVAESTQSKVKEIKGNKEEVEEEIKTPPSPPTNLPKEIQERINSNMSRPLADVFRELDTNQEWKEKMCMLYKIPGLNADIKLQNFDKLLNRFYHHLSVERQEKEKSMKDTYSHFSNWIKKVPQNTT